MPLVRIDLAEGKPAAYRAAIAEAVYQALRTTLNVPADDRFLIVTEHPADGLLLDPTYLDIQRSADALVVQVTLNAGRSLDMKRAFYRAVADGLHTAVGLRQEDVLISLVEVVKENWSFGNGQAQYA